MGPSLGHLGTSWDLLGPPGTSWDLLGPPGTSWDLLIFHFKVGLTSSEELKKAIGYATLLLTT
jgi:hypothetical protein